MNTAEAKPPVLYSKHHIPLLVKTAPKAQGKAAASCHPARGVGREMPLDIKALQSSQKFAFDLEPHIFTWEKYLHH